ncbi:MAG: peptidoglycan DD-metalloendopeptidase family protein [Eubacteriales bacterium]
MNKEKILSFIKGRQFYFVLLLGFIAIFSIATLVISNESKDNANSNKEYVDLNEPLDEGDNSDEDKLEPTDSDSLDNDNSSDEKETVFNEDVVDNDIDLEEDNLTPDIISDPEPESVETAGTGVEVEEDNDSDETELTFNETQGLIRPLEGDVLIPYSMERSIYFETLDQYKCHSAMSIKAMVGTEVKVAANGIVTEIKSNDELGTMVFIEHGSGYKTVYGQLKDLQVKEGDKLNQGATIGLVDEPTIYYSIEGSHLYFKVTKDDESVDPESLLKD